MAEIQARMAVPVGALIERARASGAIGDDVTITDLGMVLSMLCTVADLGAQAHPDLWRRYLPSLLAGLRPGGPERAVAPLTEAEFTAASAALAQPGRRDLPRRTRTARTRASSARGFTPFRPAQ